MTGSLLLGALLVLAPILAHADSFRVRPTRSEPGYTGAVRGARKAAKDLARAETLLAAGEYNRAVPRLVQAMGARDRALRSLEDLYQVRYFRLDEDAGAPGADAVDLRHDAAATALRKSSALGKVRGRYLRALSSFEHFHSKYVRSGARQWLVTGNQWVEGVPLRLDVSAKQFNDVKGQLRESHWGRRAEPAQRQMRAARRQLLQRDSPTAALHYDLARGDRENFLSASIEGHQRHAQVLGDMRSVVDAMSKVRPSRRALYEAARDKLDRQISTVKATVQRLQARSN